MPDLNHKGVEEELYWKWWKFFRKEPYSKIDSCKVCGRINYDCSCLEALEFLVSKILEQKERAVEEAIPKPRVAPMITDAMDTLEGLTRERAMYMLGNTHGYNECVHNMKVKLGLVGNSYGRSCFEKVRYAEKEKAEAVVARKQVGKKGGVKPELVNLHAYSCEYCSGWHIGHKKDQLKPNSRGGGE